jgi:myo-inositol-1(or 4)-monophosphatase
MVSAEHWSFMATLARLSGEEIRRWFGKHDLGLELKADESPVTVADRNAEEIMRDAIMRTYPLHGILGEEFGNLNPDAEFVWVLDPIDGTKAFATACPLFGTLIGLLYEGRPVLGCIHQPILGQLMIGDGSFTTLNDTVVRVRQTSSLNEATVLLTDFHHAEKYGKHAAAHDQLLRDVRLVRTWGDCYGYLLLASGWADVCLDPIMNPWDVLPLVPIVRGAGGIITDWEGGSVDHTGANSSVAAVPGLHAEVIRRLNAPR